MITRFTITGADDSIKPEDLLPLSKKYPFVEWGILCSKTAMGGNRFPSQEWLFELADLKTIHRDDLNLSCHLCGRWVRELLKNKMDFIDELTPDIWRIFDRVQINTHAEKHGALPEAFAFLALLQEKEFIIQYDNVNTKIISLAKAAGVNYSALFDLSHGIGVLPEFWPNLLPDVKCGYAGGLAPENLEEQIKRIEEKAGQTEIWIDMETHVRSDYDRLFDLKKVETCLEIASKLCPSLTSV